MRIGKVSSLANISIQTLRFYERKGFLPPPARNTSGYRVYNSTDVKRVGFIKHSQQLGFSLREIKELLTIHEQFAAPRRGNTARWKKAVRIARERLALIDHKLASLTAMRAQLAGALGEAAERPQESCPVQKSNQTNRSWQKPPRTSIPGSSTLRKKPASAAASPRPNKSS
jgi:DNA-binding transcriptional MerR regulator